MKVIARGREVKARKARIWRHKSPYSKKQMLTIDVFGNRLGENGAVCLHGEALGLIKDLEKILNRCKEMVNSKILCTDKECPANEPDGDCPGMCPKAIKVY